MNTLEYVLTYTGLIAYLILTLNFIGILRPSFTIRPLLLAIATIANRPASKIITAIYVPRGVTITIHDNIIENSGTTINYGELKDLIELGVISKYDQDKNIIIELNVRLNSLDLANPGFYELEITCTRLGQVFIKIIGIQEESQVMIAHSRA